MRKALWGFNSGPGLAPTGLGVTSELSRVTEHRSASFLQQVRGSSGPRCEGIRVPSLLLMQEAAHTKAGPPCFSDHPSRKGKQN